MIRVKVTFKDAGRVKVRVVTTPDEVIISKDTFRVEPW
jgi:hypothetical protein